MTTTDLGKLRSLASCADSDGFFTVLAVDHPASSSGARIRRLSMILTAALGRCWPNGS